MHRELLFSPDQYSLEHHQRVDRVCADYERGFCIDQRSKVTEWVFLAELDIRPLLCFELIKLDVELRRRSGESISLSDYAELAIEHQAAVAAAWDEDGPPGGWPVENPRGGECSVGHPPESEHRFTIGRFVLTERLGEGGFGTVWKAIDTELDRRVAIKIPRCETGRLTMGATVGECFLREARAAAQLEHPHIVSVLEAGTVDGVVYIVSDLVDGVTLNRWADQRRSSSGEICEKEVARLGSQIADAIGHAHQQGVIHRDLKPANILVDGNAQTHLTDFGLARREFGEDTVTAAEQVLGTPAYMSPEQAQGDSHQADRRSDVYSIGAILFELCTGERPFRGNTRMLLHQVIHVDPPSPRQFNPHVSRDLETIVLKCLEKAPSHRYQTADQVHDELRRLIAGEPIVARSAGGASRAWKWCRRNPTVAAMVCLLAVLAVGGPVVAWTQARLRDRAETFQREAEKQVFRANLAVEAEIGLREELRHRLYRADMVSAYSAWKFGNVERVVDLLNQHRPGFHHGTGAGQDDLRSFEWHLLWHLSHPDVLSLRSDGISKHGCNPYVLAVSPDGSWLATGNEIGSIETWAIDSRSQLDAYAVHQGVVASVGISPDGEKLASGGDDGIVVLVNRRTGEVLQRFRGHQGIVTGVVFSPDGGTLVSIGGDDHTVRLWDLHSGQLRAIGNGHADAILSAVFFPDGKTLATASFDGEVRLWDVQTGRAMATYQQPHGVLGLAVSPKGTMLAVASTNASHFRLYEIDGDGLVESAVSLGGEHAGGVFAACFSSDAASLATSSADRTIKIWQMPSGQLLKTLKGYPGAVSRIAFVAETKDLVSLGDDGNLKLWDVASLINDGLFRGHQEIVSSARFSPDGKTLLSASFDGTVRLWNVGRGTQRNRWALRGLRVEFAPDGESFVVGLDSGDLQQRSTKSGELLKRYSNHDKPIHAVQFSPDGRQLASASEDGVVLVRRTGSERPMFRLEGYQGWTGGLVFVPGRDLLAWTTGDLVRLTNSKTGDDLGALDGHLGSVFVLAVSPDGSVLASGTTAGEIRLWDLSGQEPRHKVSLRGSDKNVLCLAFSPDGKTLVSGNGNGDLRFWEVRSGEQTGTLSPDVGKISSLHFSVDGKRLLMGAYDGTLKMWQVAQEGTGNRSISAESQQDSVWGVERSTIGSTR